MVKLGEKQKHLQEVEKTEGCHSAKHPAIMSSASSHPLGSFKSLSQLDTKELVIQVLIENLDEAKN
jgi:hypothetical protein